MASGSTNIKKVTLKDVPGSGALKKAATASVKSTKKKKSRLDEIMGKIKKSRE